MLSAARRLPSKTAAGLAAAAAAAAALTLAPAEEARCEIKPITCRDGTSVTPWSAPTRAAHVARLKQETFDVLVVGGGCVGSGCALDAQTRGMSAALVERDDFCAGTSSRSTKLIHGGIRYLENAFFKLDYGSYELVVEALEERAHMLRAAPYMNKPLPIMIPIYRWWEVPYMWIGTKVYDVLAGSDTGVPGSHVISADEAVFRFPMLEAEGLRGAIIYYDGQMNDARMCLTLALTAAQEGAAIANRVTVLGLHKDAAGVVRGAHARDELTGEEFTIRARCVINATGPFVDAVRRMDDAEAQSMIVPAGGCHLTLPDHFSPDSMGLIVPKTRDGRVLFFLPWEGATICGTTDSVTDLTMLPTPSEEEISFILEESNKYLAKQVGRGDVRAAWSGIRPLARDLATATGGDGDTASISRNHVIEVSDSKLVTITGGKWTTYRRMAEDTVSRAVDEVPELVAANPCRTRNMALLGADRVGIVCDKKFDRITVTLREHYHMDKDVAEHLTRNYGTRALQVAELANPARSPDVHSRRLIPQFPFLEAEVLFAMDQEYAEKLVDVIARRTRLAFVNADSCRAVLPAIADLMAKHKKWPKKRVAEEVAEAQAFLDSFAHEL